MTYTPQYLGDLEDNSPLPFSIPLAIGINDDNASGSSSSLAAGDYPVSLKITYSDELRNPQEVILNTTVSYSPPQEVEAAPNQGFLGIGSSSSTATDSSTSNNFVPPLVFIFLAIGAAAVVIIMVRKRRSRTKKISRLMGSQEDNDDFELSSSDEYLSSSSEDESSDKK
jgi:hypothetical protein